MAKKRQPVTDFKISRLVLKFEQNLYRILENAPKKYDYDLKQQTKDVLGFMKRLLAKSLKILPYSRSMWRYKTDLLNDAYAEIGLLQFNLCQLNDLAAISNKSKVCLDIQLAEIELNFLNLLSSFTKKAGGSDVIECALDAESEIIRTCNCDETEGGSDA